jgi:hypothetical protein
VYPKKYSLRNALALQDAPNGVANCAMVEVGSALSLAMLTARSVLDMANTTCASWTEWS